MTNGYLIDTNVAIHLRDRHLATLERFAGLDRPPLLSILTRVELEAGVATRPDEADRIGEGNRALFERLPTLALDHEEVDAYAAIVRAAGYSRRRTIDRLIAATAIVHGLTLITINGDDFRDIPGLSLDVWPAQ